MSDISTQTHSNQGKQLPSSSPPNDIVLNEAVLANAAGIRGPHPIPKARQRKNTFCRIFSVKAGMRIVQTESVLEADAIYYAEGNPDVVSLCEQPMRIPLPVERSPYITLDLSLLLRDGREVLYEIKPDSKLDADANGRRVPPNWPLIENWCSYHGFSFAVLTDIELEKHKQRIRNWRTLLPFVRFAHERPNPSLERQLLDTLEVHGSLSLSSLVEYVSVTPRQEKRKRLSVPSKRSLPFLNRTSLPKFRSSFPRPMSTNDASFTRRSEN